MLHVVNSMQNIAFYKQQQGKMHSVTINYGLLIIATSTIRKIATVIFIYNANTGENID